MSKEGRDLHRKDTKKSKKCGCKGKCKCPKIK